LYLSASPVALIARENLVVISPKYVYGILTDLVQISNSMLSPVMFLLQQQLVNKG